MPLPKIPPLSLAEGTKPKQWRSRCMSFDGASAVEDGSREPGLVYVSYLPATIRAKGGLIQTKAQRMEEDFPPPALRGVIHGFSQAARKRQLETLAQIDPLSPLPLFATLTFPDEFNGNLDDARDRLDVLCKRWFRNSPDRGILWRLEVKKRQSGKKVGEWMPHLHLFIWNGGKQIDLEQLSREWWEVCGKLSDAHLAAGTNCEWIESQRGVMFYASKYSAKLSEAGAPETFGRIWGMINKARIPFGNGVAWEVPRPVAMSVRRTMRRYLQSRGYRRKGAPLSTLFISDAEALTTRLVRLFAGSGNPLVQRVAEA